MNCIWILLLLCLCNGNGSWGNSDCQNSCGERRRSWGDNRGCEGNRGSEDNRSCDGNRRRRDENEDCDCGDAGRSTCNMDRDDRRDDRRNDRRGDRWDDRRFPMPPFAPETGRCCEASESSIVEDSIEE